MEFVTVQDNDKYEISKEGIIRHKKKGTTLQHHLKTDKGGYQYYYVHLCISEKQGMERSVHRLLATAFIQKIEGCPFVDHIDGNSLKNTLSNLRWIDRSGNARNPNNRIHKNNTSGHKNISYRKDVNKWIIRKYGVHYGFYNTLEEAILFRDSIVDE